MVLRISIGHLAVLLHGFGAEYLLPGERAERTGGTWCWYVMHVGHLLDTVETEKYIQSLSSDSGIWIVENDNTFLKFKS